jgi:para-nitrobenzyl esterase
MGCPSVRICYQVDAEQISWGTEEEIPFPWWRDAKRFAHKSECLWKCVDFKSMRIDVKMALIVALAFLTLDAQADPLTAKTGTGFVRGVLDENVIAYKGLPFATPPLGNLRWREPQPVNHWKGVLAANRFPSQCSQLGPPLSTMPEEPTSEDCLYLNLWTPAKHSNRKLPVMVFFYGGEFLRGSASTPLYASGGLPKATGIILVTLNYRVGALGFLAHPELSAESPHRVSGNYALLDAIAGLKWIQRNVSAFGGDPHRVTIFGQSAGSQLVSLLMISPPARGLFSAAIAESNANMGPGMLVLADAERSGAAFSESLGAKSLADLRKIPAEKITASPFEAWPNVDGYVIPDETYSLYARGRQAPVPLLLGYNEDEGQYFQTPTTTTDYKAAVRKKYGSFADQVLELFPGGTEEAARSKTQLWAESAFGWQMWSWARIDSSNSKQKTFFYCFSSKYGSGHGAELPFVFQYPFGAPWDDDQRDMGRKIAAYWTNFARTGDPNGGELPTWPTFNAKTNSVMYIGEKFEAGTMPQLRAHFLFDTYMNSKRSW